MFIQLLLVGVGWVAWKRANQEIDDLDPETDAPEREGAEPEAGSESAEAARIETFAERSFGLLAGAAVAKQLPIVRLVMGPLLLVHAWPLFRAATRERGAAGP